MRLSAHLQLGYDLNVKPNLGLCLCYSVIFVGTFVLLIYNLFKGLIPNDAKGLALAVFVVFFLPIRMVLSRQRVPPQPDPPPPLGPLSDLGVICQYEDLPELSPGQVCTVCLCDLEPGEKVFRMRCRHVFHEECIGGWLKSARTCPTCRCTAVSEAAEETKPAEPRLELAEPAAAGPSSLLPREDEAIAIPGAAVETSG